jgi:hypothetical protein
MSVLDLDHAGDDEGPGQLERHCREHQLKAERILPQDAHEVRRHQEQHPGERRSQARQNPRTQAAVGRDHPNLPLHLETLSHHTREVVEHL